MKRQFACMMIMLLTMAAWAKPDFGTEAKVSTTTTWTFEDLSDVITAHSLVKESGYLRAYPRSQNDRQFTFESATGTVTFDVDVTYTKVAKASAKMVGINSTGFTTAATAGMESPSVCIPGFAFNSTVAGTVYVAMKSTSTNNGGQRIYFNNGTEAKLVKQSTATGGIDIFSYTSTEAGSFFIGDVLGAFDLYAVKFVPTAIEPTPSTDVVSVFITAGQSNTAGRCSNDNLPDYIKTLGAENSGAYQYCNWSYTNSTNRNSESEGVFRKFWPEREKGTGEFAYDAIVYYWLEKALKEDFYVIKHAMGGTSIDPSCESSGNNHWSADATWLTDNESSNTTDGHSMLKALCSNIDKSLDAITAMGKTYDIKAMIWHQGESDRKTDIGINGYHDNLKELVKYVRDYLVTKTGNDKYSNLDFICGTVPKQSSQYNETIYNSLFTLQNEDEHFHVIETSPGTFIGDNLHFDSNCAERLGIGMYNKMVELNIVDGESQDVPDVVYPESDANTMDFQLWTQNEGMATTEYVNLILSETPVKTADGTDVYAVTGCIGTGDFSQFADRFAIAVNTTSGNDKVRLRGQSGLFLASNQTSVLSLLNLKQGDVVSIKFKPTTANKTTLAFMSENVYTKTDADKTVITKGTALTSEAEYVMTTDGQLDMTFGSEGSHTIYSITVVPAEDESDEPVSPTDDPTTAVTIHTIGDSTMSSYDQSIAAQKGMDGWGDYLIDCMKSEWTTVKNWADRGETAKSYYNGIWLKTSADRPEFGEPVMNKVKEGDYVIIQFGHNDSKAYSTVQYEKWLGTLVDAIKAKGATPIMAGSICRARFDKNGNITRLGRIDTYEEDGRIAEPGAEINNYSFDYPYHAKQVAEAKGIEFIDVTSGVMEMFETYGEAKTKALFPSGEKTHTNKLGAQLIAKVAARLLLGTSLKNYVDTETLELPSADDIDIIIDDFKGEAAVTKKVIWTFNDYKNGEVIAAAVANSEVTETTKNVVEIDGLYARGFTNRGINAVTSTINKVTFSDDDATEVEVKIAALPSQNYDASVTSIAQNTAGRVGASALAPTFAVNIGKPGTFYCILAPTKNNSERNIRMIFSGKEVVSIPVSEAYANENHLCEVKYHAENTGVIYLSPGIAPNFYAMMFIPDMEAGTEEDWNYQMVMTREEGLWTYTNMAGWNQSVPEGLTAYAVSGIDSDGNAVLSDIGTVIGENMGVIVKGEANTEYALPQSGTGFIYTGANMLVPNTELRYLPATEDGKTNYYFDGTQFVKASGGETIHEKQAYLRVNSSADVIPITYAPTSINAITDSSNPMTAAAKVIKAGKIIIIKAGKEYNVIGERIF